MNSFFKTGPRKANTPGWNREKMEKMRGSRKTIIGNVAKLPPQNDMVQQLGIKAGPSTKQIQAKQLEKKQAQQQKKEKEEFQQLILNQGKPLTKDQKDFNEVIGAK